MIPFVPTRSPAGRQSPVPLLTAADARVTNPRIHRDPSFIAVRRGVHAPRQAFLALAPWERYTARVHAFALAHPDAVLYGPSACAVHGFPVLGRPTRIHIFDPDRTASRRFGDVTVHTSVDGREVERVGGVLTTGAVDTVLDSVRSLSPAASVALCDAAARSEGTGILRRVHDRAASQVSGRGLARLGLALSLADARAESVAESVSRVAIEWLGFERPDPQVVFPWEGGTDRVDFCWRSVRAIGECDGYGKYVDDPSATAAERVMQEKRRENRLRRICRAFDRWEWSDLMAITPLERRLVAMGVPRPNPPRHGLLLGIRPEAF